MSFVSGAWVPDLVQGVPPPDAHNSRFYGDGYFVVDTLRDLRSLRSTSENRNRVAFLKGKEAPFDGLLQGIYAYVPEGSQHDQEDNGGGFVLANDRRSAWRKVDGVFGVEHNVVVYGADPTGIEEATDSFSKAVEAASPGDILFVPPGTFELGSVTINKDVGMYLMPGAVLRHKGGATGSMIIYTSSGATRIEGGVFDGNKANNTSTSNWHSLLMLSGRTSVIGVKFENYVHSAIRSLRPGRYLVSDCEFRNGAEHHATDSPLYLTTAIHIDISAGYTNENIYITIRDSEVIQDAAPVVDRASPGGFIFAGSHANNTWVIANVLNCRFENIGQDYGLTHIGNIDFYENTKNGVVFGNQFYDWQYIPCKIQNSLNPKIIGNTIEDGTTTLTEASGGAAILMDINRNAQGLWYGGGIIAFNHITLTTGHASDGINAIEVSGRPVGGGVFEYYSGAKVVGNVVSNAKGRAFYMGSVSGMTTVEKNNFSGWGKNAGEGAFEIENAIGSIFKSGNIVTALVNGTGSHGVFQRDSLTACAIYEEDEHYIASGVGFTAAVYGEHARLSLDGVRWNGNGGAAYLIAGATGGAVTAFLFMTPSNQVISGATTVTWSKVTLFKGFIEIGGNPEGTVPATENSFYFDTTGGALFRKNLGTGTTGWRPVETNGAQFIGGAGGAATLKDGTIFANAASSAQTYDLSTLIPPATCPGKRITIQKYDSSGNTVTIQGTEGPDIVLSAQFESKDFRCTGISWVPINYV